MNLFDKNETEKDLLRELYAQPCLYYLVTFYYHEKDKPKEIKTFEFKQYDSDPYFPRINRFYEFCIQRMKNKFKFIDYDAKVISSEVIRYQENIENEFKIH
jgi:uncharacterized protein Usg